MGVCAKSGDTYEFFFRRESNYGRQIISYQYTHPNKGKQYCHTDLDSLIDQGIDEMPGDNQ